MIYSSILGPSDTSAPPLIPGMSESNQGAPDQERVGQGLLFEPDKGSLFDPVESFIKKFEEFKQSLISLKNGNFNSQAQCSPPVDSANSRRNEVASFHA